MTVTLRPEDTALFAQRIYSLSHEPTLEKAAKKLQLFYGEQFALSEGSLLTAKTGALGPMKVKTAFGHVLVDKGRNKNSIVLVRGTQYLADWLTNLNVGVSNSASGQKVHDGFNRAFHSMLPQLKPMIAQLPQDHQVHCVGHSLGGALASLAAEWIKTNTSFQPQLYTFGAPRVGLESFAKRLTKELRGEVMYRAYHKTDVVPFIPVWPFTHAPVQGQDYYLPSPGILPAAEYHGMKHYINSVRGKSWKQLTSLRPAPITASDIKAWLSDAGVVGLTITSMRYLSAAIVWVLETCLKALKIAFNSALATGTGLLDLLARILASGLKLDEHVSRWVSYLLKKIAQFVGALQEWRKADYSQELIKQLFIKLQTKMHHVAYQALSRTLADGRAL